MAALSNVDLCSKYPKILDRSGTYAGNLVGRCMSVLWQLAREKSLVPKCSGTGGNSSESSKGIFENAPSGGSANKSLVCDL
jgi:hypothetical protein